MAIGTLNSDPMLVLPPALITDFYIACQLLMFHFAHRHGQPYFCFFGVANQAAVAEGLLLERLHLFDCCRLAHICLHIRQRR